MSLRRIHGLSIAGALLLAVMPTTAFSDEAPDETGLTAGEVYDLVNDEFPGVIDTRTVDSKSTDDEVAVEAEDGSSEAFVIPADPDEPFEGPADPVEISLPETLPTNDSAVVEESVIHTDLYDSTSAIVTPTSSSSFEIYYLMHDEAAPTSFFTELSVDEGSTIRQTSHNRLDVMNSEDQITLTIEAPWAWDAEGREIPVRLAPSAGGLTTSVDLPDTVTYPILVDPAFGTFGDYVHRTSNSDGTLVASGHGWWTASGLGPDPRANVNVKLYNYFGGKWHMVQSTTKKNVKPSKSPGNAPSSRRANARDVCSSFGLYKWYSVIDVDVVGISDPPSKYRTATRTIPCRA